MEFHSRGRVHVLRAGDVGIVEPEVSHHVTPLGAVRFCTSSSGGPVEEKAAAGASPCLSPSWPAPLSDQPRICRTAAETSLPFTSAPRDLRCFIATPVACPSLVAAFTASDTGPSAATISGTPSVFGKNESST